MLRSSSKSPAKSAVAATTTTKSAVAASRRKSVRAVLLGLWALGCAGAVVYGCSSDDEDSGSTNSGTGNSGNTGASAGTAGGDTGGGTAGGATGGTGTGGTIAFGDTQCTDGEDNDMDGFTDSLDVECVGPLDNDEGSFATGIPGDNSDACKQDCFFDGDSGSGNDGCLWNLKCDPLNPGAPDCPYDASFMNCPGPQPQKCIDNCQGYTPNGCDCFGCCTVTVGSTEVTIKLGAGCTEEQALDPTVCKPCTKVASCQNTCELCEYCLGKPTLPPECFPSGSGGAGGTMGSGGQGGMGGTPNGCDPGQQACTMTMPCPANYYCLTGCCVEIPS